MPPQENRRSPRRKVRIPILCWRSIEEKKSENGFDLVTKDVSPEGVAFYSQRAYSIGTQLAVDVYLPGRKSPVSCLLRVVSLEVLLHKDEYVVGGSFCDMPASDHAALATALDQMDLYTLLDGATKEGASDIHLTVGRPPIVRHHGRIIAIAAKVIEPGQIEAMVYPLLTAEQLATFEREHELDFAFSPSINARFRVNLHRQRGYVEAVLRAIPTVSHTFEQLGLPPVIMERFCSESTGLFLIAGPTGSGKTTTLSSMVEFINRTEERVIITIEDPIEYTFQSKKSVIKQRELGTDTRSYAEALKRSLRQDPDVICVGELVDAESVFAALRAAETGRLVLSTINAPDVVSAVERVMRFFPSEQASIIGQQFASVFLGAIAQQLLSRKTGGRVLATEVLINTIAAANIMREGKVSLLANVLQTGRAHGMFPFQASIQHLHTHGLIDDVVRDTHLKKPLV